MTDPQNTSGPINQYSSVCTCQNSVFELCLIHGATIPSSEGSLPRTSPHGGMLPKGNQGSGGTSDSKRVLSAEERREIREREEAAPMAPWTRSGFGNQVVGAGFDREGNYYASWQSICKLITGNREANMTAADFIAHARQDVPALLDSLEAVEEENEVLRKQNIGLIDDNLRLWKENERLRAAIVQFKNEVRYANGNKETIRNCAAECHRYEKETLSPSNPSV